MRCRISGFQIAVIALLALAVLVRTPWAQRYVPGDDPEFPREKYADSLVSLNDRCIVSGNKLNLTIRPIYVNGSPIGFC